MQEDKKSLLIFSAPGPLGDRLSAFVAQLEQVNTVGYVQTAPDAIKAISQHPPSLIILNMYPLEDSTHDLLEFLKLHPTGAHCLILAESSAQAEHMRADLTDEVLVWGFSPEALEAKIDQLVAMDDGSALITANPGDYIVATAGGTVP